MRQNLLFEQINNVRKFLCQLTDLGSLIGEKYLLSHGDLAGYWFCFQAGEVKWRFGTTEAEIWKNGQFHSQISLLKVIEAQPDSSHESPSPAEHSLNSQALIESSERRAA